MLLFAGAVWIAATLRLASTHATPRRIAAVIACSLALSGIQLTSNPIQEADFFRYLLDGGVLVCGANPYAQTPDEWASIGGARAAAYAPKSCLSDPRWPDVLARVEYSHIRTPYPPLAQGWFATVVAVGGPSIVALRASYLGVELGMLLVLVSVLRYLGLNPLLAGVFGWSPLVFKESFNSAHYDVVPALVLTASAVLLVQRRERSAAAALGAAAALKLFTLALVPLWLRSTRPIHRRAALTLFVATAALPWLPFAAAGAKLLEGGAMFASHWTVNAPIFGPALAVLSGAGLDPGVARMILAALLVATIAAVEMAWPVDRVRPDLSVLRAARAALAILLVAGPVGNPWYFLWLLPLIAVDPRPAWLALIALQPLYYVGFFLIYHGRRDLLPLVPAIEFAPFLVLLVRDFYRNKSSAAGRRMSAAHALPGAAGRHS